MFEKIAVGSDHAGYELKEKVRELLRKMNFPVSDFGTNSTESCDYPDYARKVATSVSRGLHKYGVLCCGSGIGVSIVANKVRSVRAALVHEPEAARLSRQHNNANVLCLPARTLDQALLKDILEAFMFTSFEGGRHEKRVDKIEVLRAGETSLSEFLVYIKESEQD
jgi:ribose 5-phosphate isomerase B